MDDFTAVAPINGYGSYLPDEIIARVDLSAEAKTLCHELDKYRNCDPQSERYLQCNPGHFTLQEKCGFRSKRQVEQIVRELVDKDLIEVQPGQKAKYVLSWPPRPTAAEPIQELVQAEKAARSNSTEAYHERVMELLRKKQARRKEREKGQELVQAEKAARSRTSFEELEEKLRQRKIKDQELKASLEQSAAKEPKTWSL